MRCRFFSPEFVVTKGFLHVIHHWLFSTCQEISLISFSTSISKLIVAIDCGQLLWILLSSKFVVWLSRPKNVQKLYRPSQTIPGKFSRDVVTMCIIAMLHVKIHFAVQNIQPFLSSWEVLSLTGDSTILKSAFTFHAAKHISPCSPTMMYLGTTSRKWAIFQVLGLRAKFQM